MCKISMARLLAKFEEIYSQIDDDVPEDVIYEFREYLQDHKAFVRKFVEYRDDYISSDRERAAFIMALREVKNA